MKHTTEELLLAMEVRALAARWQSAYAGDSPDADAFKQENPLTKYILLVLGEVEVVADLIAQHRAGPPSRPAQADGG